MQTPREFQGNDLCSAEGHEFLMTERVTMLEPDAFKRIPAVKMVG